MDSQKKPTAIIMILAFLALTVALSTLYSPAANICVILLKYKIHFVFVLLLPSVLLAWWWLWRNLLSAQSESRKTDAESVLFCMMIYSLYVVFLTGGLVGSPMSSIVAIVPLLSIPVVEINTRKRMLGGALVGSILIGILSNFSLFSPASSYPNSGGWEYTGEANSWIATLILAVGLGIEIRLISLRRSVK